MAKFQRFEKGRDKTGEKALNVHDCIFLNSCALCGFISEHSPIKSFDGYMFAGRGGGEHSLTSKGCSPHSLTAYLGCSLHPRSTEVDQAQRKTVLDAQKLKLNPNQK